MKKNILYIVAILFMSNSLFSQTKLKVGDIAPKINITDYISNVPSDKNFKNKFILLEFWATWCGPCLQGVPNLNKFQEKFKSNKDFVFISITDEKVDKVLRTVKRIPFKSVVVSDQTGQTIENFGIKAFPTTILIDDKGILKWIGNPETLNDLILNNFLNGKEISTSQNSNSDMPPPSLIVRNPTKIEEFNTIDLGYKTTTIDKTMYSFSVFKGNENEGGGYLFDFNNEGNYQNWNLDLISLISNLTNAFKNHIVIPENQKDKLYSIFYKNSLFKNEKEERNKIKNLLLNSLSLKEDLTYKEESIYVLKIVDKKKLQEIFNEEGRKDGYNRTHFLIGNIKIERMLNTMSRFYNTVINDETGLLGNYDFILRNDSIENTIKDLELYGLTLEKSKANTPYYEYVSTQ
ncbi:redoxin domain-containing protein [Flavobacterium rhamnosiphilum]|uniref:Redoxin domain-containing protein n=1 Tax=Flavobacterium rhamnosiphilum TaxID=2541724 RepID=A0A4R5FCI2_9FLAO|nr:redoxin family protein [Flavobacterium rhamnosiphilum]TDE46969.1 redoxin domain-containing protein [Flavobacterium rhamnosiphilum]